MKLSYTDVDLLRVVRGRDGPGPFRSADGAGPAPDVDRRLRTGPPVVGGRSCGRRR